MDKAKEQLATVTGLIDDDLEFIRKQRTSGTKKEVARGQQQFAAHLATIISHSIGLKASVAPLNESPESMFAYLMDLFRLNDSQLENLLTNSTQATVKSDREQSSPTRLVDGKRECKCHNWQPELRLKINPPIFDGMDTGDLLVIVSISPDKVNPPTDEQTGSRNILDIIRMRGGDRLKTTKPKGRDLAEIIYTKSDETYRPHITTALDSMALIEDEQEGELHLRFRTHKASIGLDLWLEGGKNFGLKRFVCSPCCGLQKNQQTPDGDKQFLGSVSIKLSQVPAYATRNSYPVLTPPDKLVNNCDVLLEFRNGNVAKQDTNMIVNHVRLYAFCIAYQLKLLKPDAISIRLSRLHKFEPTRSSGFNLDSLLYVPAASLVNQHRLQLNITHQEDQSLRRSAILLLLTRMVRLDDDETFSDSHRLLLASIAGHEYLNAHRHFNNTTRQEIDPFSTELLYDRSREQVKLLEQNSIDDCTKILVSQDRIKTWLSRIDLIGVDLKKSDVLVGLELVKTIIAHNASNSMVDSIFSSQSLIIKNSVNKLLTSVLTEELRLRLSFIIAVMKSSSPATQAKQKGTRSRYNNQSGSPWRKLFYDIHSIENDLILHWSDAGLDSLKLNQTEASLMDDESMISLKLMIETKINNYLTSV